MTKSSVTLDAISKLLDQKFAAQDTKIDQKFAAQDTKIDQKFAAQDTKIGSLKSVLSQEIKQLSDKTDKSFNDQNDAIQDILGVLHEITNKKIDQIKDNLEQRVAKLEKHVFAS